MSQRTSAGRREIIRTVIISVVATLAYVTVRDWSLVQRAMHFG